jgi:hypothetical protein
VKLVFVIVVLALGFFADLAHAGSPDGTWLVDSRSCAGAATAPTLNERLTFAAKTVTHTSIKSATTTEYCEEGLTYARQIKTQSDIGGVYVETSMLVGQSRRMTCYAKTDGSVTSDTTSTLSPGRQSFTLQIMDNLAFADIVYSSECPKGSLHLSLKK